MVAAPDPSCKADNNNNGKLVAFDADGHSRLTDLGQGPYMKQ